MLIVPLNEFDAMVPTPPVDESDPTVLPADARREKTDARVDPVVELSLTYHAPTSINAAMDYDTPVGLTPAGRGWRTGGVAARVEILRVVLGQQPPLLVAPREEEDTSAAPRSTAMIPAM